MKNRNDEFGWGQLDAEARLLKRLGRMLKAGVLLVGLLLLITEGKTQELVALKVGDKVPAAFWDYEHSVYQNGKANKLKMADYKGKVILLDFWATWCGSCFKKFPFLDSLQQVKAEQLKVILVNTKKTGDTYAKVKTKIDDFARDLGLILPTIYEDEYLKALFPHYMLSHYVWIDAKGQIMAFTGADFVNDTTINTIANRKYN